MAVWARVRARAMARARVTLSKSREESTCKGKSVSQTEGKSQRTGNSESKMSYASLPEPLRYRLKTMAGWAEREGGRGRRMGRREGRG